MNTEQNKESLEDLLYSKNGYKKRNLSNLIKKISKGKWGNVEDKVKISHGTDFDERYMQQQRLKNGYSLTTKQKGNEEAILAYEKHHSYQYEEGNLLKLKKSWDKKSFWYKLLIIDIIVGSVVHLGLTLFTDIL